MQGYYKTVSRALQTNLHGLHIYDVNDVFFINQVLQAVNLLKNDPLTLRKVIHPFSCMQLD